MLRGAHLRAAANRKLLVEGGSFSMSNKRSCVELPEFEAVGADGKTKKIVQAESEVVISTVAECQILEKTVAVRPNPKLFELGYVQYDPYLLPEDGRKKLQIKFYAKEKVDLTKLGPLFQLFISE